MQPPSRPPVPAHRYLPTGATARDGQRSRPHRRLVLDVRDRCSSRIDDVKGTGLAARTSRRPRNGQLAEDAVHQDCKDAGREPPTSETPLRSAATYADPLEAATTPAELGKPMVLHP